MKIGRRRLPPGVLIAVLSLLGLLWYLVLFFDTRKPPDEVPPFDSAAALALCQLTFQRTSTTPAQADVPVVRGVETAREYQFVWDRSTQMMRLLGDAGPQSEGVCSVSKVTRTLSSLSLNGQSLF